MLRIVCCALFALALVVMPASIAPQFGDQARAEATTKADKGAEKATKSEKKKTKKKTGLTAGQKAARERQKQCGTEWREAKKAGKVEKSMTWPKFWSACNTRLKGKA